MFLSPSSFFTYSDHEAFQLLRLGPILLHDGPDLDEGGEPENEEDGAHHQGDEEGHEHEVAEAVGVPKPDEADAGQDVA